MLSDLTQKKFAGADWLMFPSSTPLILKTKNLKNKIMYSLHPEKFLPLNFADYSLENMALLRKRATTNSSARGFHIRD